MSMREHNNGHSLVFHWKNACLVMLAGFTGCKHLDVQGPIVPIRTETVAGHRYSAEAIRFLDAENVTVDEVVATLGKAAWESARAGVLVYTWTTQSRFFPMQIISLDEDSITKVRKKASIGTEIAIGEIAREWGLFVAYDGEGFVRAHEVRRIGSSHLEELEEVCVQWRQDLEDY